MEKSKKMSVKKLIVIIFAAVLLLATAALAVWLIAFQGTKIVPANDPYSYQNPAEVKAQPDEGFIIDGILDEAQYQNCNWLKLKNTQGGAGAELAMTSFYGENGMYIVYDITENAMIYVNPDRPSYLNSCIEMYLATSNASSMNSNEIFEIDMLPTGDLSVRQRTGKDNWVNAASTDDIMAHLGATTKGGPVNTEQCTGYYLELFIPWAYLDKVGIDAAAMQESFFYINPVHITSFNYEGTNASSDRYWYGFATQLGSDGWNDVSQFFRFGAKGVLGTVPVELKSGANYTISGNDSVIPGMMTVVEIKPDAGYALSSIIINGEEHIDRVSYNKDGSVTLQLRGEKEGLTISATATEVTQGNKTLSGSVQMHKLGGDTLEGVEVSYKGPQGEKPITIDSDGKFQLTGLEQGYYIVTAMKQGYTPINRGIYLNRDVETVLVLEYEMFQPESGYNWILDDQNDGVLNRFGGSGKILSVDSYDKFAVEAAFRYDAELAEMSDGDTYMQQRAGIQIKFSNGKYWRIDLMRENGVFKVQYAKHNDATVFGWKTVHELTESEIAQYQSEKGIKLSVLRDGRYAWVCLDGKPVAIEVLDSEYADCTAQIGFEGWIANKEIAQMQYNIRADVNKNLRSFHVGTSEKWNISGQFDGVLRLPGGGTNFLKFHYPYNDFEFALKNVRENDTTGSKPGRTDILLEFDLNGDGQPDKSISFGITCTDRANKICWLQTLGNADNYIPVTRIKGLYKLSAKEAEKYLYGYGVELRVIRKGTDVYVFLDGEEVAIWDLTQNNSGVTAQTPASLSIRHYDAPGDVTLNFEISDHVGEVKIDRLFKDNEKWDLSNQYQGVVILPGGGTDTSLQFLKKYQNIDLTLTAKEHYTTEGSFGRTDVLFEFDLDNDGTMDKNVSFGIIQLTGGRCVLQTLGWDKNHIPANRINELYELTYAQAQKYKGTGIDFRVVRYKTTVYLYLDDAQVATFDLTQNDSGVKAESKATMFLRHYDAIADEVVIPFKVTEQVEKPEPQEQTKPVFKPNYKWDLSGQYEGTVALPNGGSSAVTFVDRYTDFNVVIKNVKENDTTGTKPGRTDILLEFDTDGDGVSDKNVSFGIVCVDPAAKLCWLQTLGNADNHIPANRISGLYKLSEQEAEKYLNGDGVELRVIRKGIEAYVFLDGEVVAIWDLSQNDSGVTANMEATLSFRHYDAEGNVTLNFEISDKTGAIKVDKIFKDNDKWDLSDQKQGIVALPGGGTDNSLQFLKKYQNIDLTLTAKEHYTTEGSFGRTDVLFEFDLDNDGTMDKNVSFGIIQLTGGRCVLQTLGWDKNHIPANRINELYELTYAQAQKYKGAGIDFRVVRYKTTVYLYLDDAQVATFDLTQNDSGVKAESKATMFLRHYDAIADEVVIPFKVTAQVEKPGSAEQEKPVFKPNFAWDLSKQHEGVVSLPGGGYGAVTFNNKYVDFDVAIKNVRENDTTGTKPGRTDILLEFDTNSDGKIDKSASFGIVCTDPAAKLCWLQTLGNADNHIPANRISGLYKLSEQEAEKYLNGDGVELRVIRKGIEVYVFLDGEVVAIWDLSQNNSGVTATTEATLSFRHYDAEGNVTLNFEISDKTGDIKVDKIFKDNDKWDLTKQHEGVVTLPGGGTDLSLQLFKKYQNIDMSVTAREHDTTGEKFGRTDILFEFDLDQDGKMDKNVSFGIVQLTGGRCVIQTLGWSDNHIPETRINELYELTYAQTLKYKQNGIELRVVRYGTDVYIYVDGTQVAVFDLTQNESGVQADSKATVFLRHYDAVADEIVIPFKVTDQVEKPELQEQTKPVFKPNYKWDLSDQYEGVVSLPGGGTNALAFYDQFTDIDLTITAKENKAATAQNGGRTDILFEFENGKNVSFGIVKWSATSSCIVETLGNSTNHIPSNRKNTLYKLSEAETNAYLTDGVQLRVVRLGTDIHVILENRIVAVFDLMQSDSGVTADMPATVSLRHYDAVTDQVVIPFTVTEDIAQVTITDNSADGAVGAKNEVNFVGAEVILGSKTPGRTLTGLKLDGVEVPLNTDGTYSFIATKSEYAVEGFFASAIFEGNYDDTLWDISGQNEGYVTVIGGGGSTAQPLQLVGSYQNIDLTINARDYADSSTAARTDVGFEFDVDGDGVINTAKGDQTVTFGVVYTDGYYCVQTRAGTLLNWKRPYELTQAEIDQYVITAAEIASGNEDGLDFRMIRYGTVMYLFVENKQVAFCDLTKCANSSGDKASNVTAETEMFVYLRHYDDKRVEGVEIPFTISTEVTPVTVSLAVSGQGTVTANSVNYYINNSRTSKYSDMHFMGEKITLTAKAAEGNALLSFLVDGVEQQLGEDGIYQFVASRDSYEMEATFGGKQIFETNYDTSLWDISGQNEGYVTVIGGGGSTAQPLQFAGTYQNVDMTINARDYADSSSLSRTDVEFAFDVNGDGVIDTAKGDQTVTFGIAEGNRVQTRGGTILSWKTPYDLSQTEKDQLVITAAEVAAGNEDGLDLRIIRYGTTVYLFVEGKQVAFCDLTKCANSAGDTESGVTADTKMLIYLRHYDDKRTGGVKIPFSISTEVTPAELSVSTNGEGTVTAGEVNYYINNGRTSKLSDIHFMDERIELTVTPATGNQVAEFVVDGVTKTLTGNGTYSFVASKSAHEITVVFGERKIFETNYDSTLWDISGQNEGYVTVIGGGGSTAQPLQFAGSYQDIDLTVNARDYADSSTAARTDVEFTFDVDGDGVINTSKGDQTVTFGVVYSDKAYRVQTRGGTLLNWKTPHDLTQAEIDKFVITAAEVNSGNEDGLDLRMVRYGTVMYLFVENRQVAFCDLTKCANSAGDKASNVKADTEMYVYLRHYDDKRAAGVEIPFSISTEVTPASIAVTTNGQGAVTANSVNYYINNGRTSKASDTHFIGEKVVLTIKPETGKQITGFKVNGVEVQFVKNADGSATYSFTVTKQSYSIEVIFA